MAMAGVTQLSRAAPNGPLLMRKAMAISPSCTRPALRATPSGPIMSTYRDRAIPVVLCPNRQSTLNISTYSMSSKAAECHSRHSRATQAIHHHKLPFSNPICLSSKQGSPISRPTCQSTRLQSIFNRVPSTLLTISIMAKQPRPSSCPSNHNRKAEAVTASTAQAQKVLFTGSATFPWRHPPCDSTVFLSALLGFSPGKHLHFRKTGWNALTNHRPDGCHSL